MKVSQRTKTPPTNLPSPLSTFIGREHEIGEVKRLLASNRLVTLTGAGGSGKTRLSLMVAHKISGDHVDGIWFAELASIFDATLIPQIVASALNIHEQSGQAFLAVLISHIAEREILIVLDNCEHLISACAQFVESILQGCPNLKILATSREVLGIPGEVAWTVPPLSLPGQHPWVNTTSSSEALRLYRESESVQLFVARAQTNSPGFELTVENGSWVAEICRRLDGMPLALELAAARVRSLSVQQIAQRLDDRFNLLTGGSRTASPRQQTLLATLDWSYALLSDTEQKVLQRLAVFAGGATLDAAESVCAGKGIESADVLDTLFHLVDKSLLIADKSQRRETPSSLQEFARYRVLETIRQYALEKLMESGEADESRNRHLDYFVQWTEKVTSNRHRDDQLFWLEQYEAEYDNLRSALNWSSNSESTVHLGLRLATSLVVYWHSRGYYSEGRTQFSALLEKTKRRDRPEARAEALYHASGLAFVQTDYPATQALAEESISIYRELGAAGKLGLARTLIRLGDMWRQLGNYETAFSMLEEGLQFTRELKDLDGLVEALWQLGYYAISIGDFRRADQYFAEALPFSKQESTSFDTTVILSGLAESSVRQGDFGRAAVFEEESLQLRRQLGDKWGIAVSLGNFAWIALHQDDLGKAETLLLESLTIRNDITDRGGMAWCLEKLAKINILYGQKKSRLRSIENFRRAVRLLGAAAALRAPVGSVIDQADKPEYERDLETLRTALGQDVFSDLWSAGQTIPLEVMIESASLGSDDSRSKSTHSEKVNFGGLTAREREVAILIAKGKSNREIAETMTVGVKTIETYVTRVLSKLGFDSRVQIAMWAMENGLKE